MESAKLARGLLATKEKRLSIVLPPGIHRELKRIAAEENTTIKEVVIEAFQQYIYPTYRGKQYEE